VNAIFTYHSLDESGSVISTRPESFGRQMEALAASGVKVVPLTEISLHRDAAAITFDDAFANFGECAVPVLERLSLPATVFVVSGYSGGHNNWPTQPPGVPCLPLMSWSALRSLPPGISLGAHTVTHPDLRVLDEADMMHEVRDSRSEIEQKTGRAVETFAYPYGAVDVRTADVVRDQFAIGCGTRLRYTGPKDDAAVLPRLDTYYLKSAAWFRNPLGVAARSYIAARRMLREARQAR